MSTNRLSRFRFSLKSIFVLIFGIAIGYSLNIQTLRLLVGLANEANMGLLPTYVVEPPDILLIEVNDKSSDTSQLIAGQRLVGPDGKINLGSFGQVSVAGMTISEVQDAVKEVIEKDFESVQVFVDVLAYNSKVYYIVEQSPGAGDSVVRVPITGKETILDAVAHMGGLKSPASTQVWITRPSLSGVGTGKILPVEWDKIANGASTANYQLLPGDRVFVSRKSTLVPQN